MRKATYLDHFLRMDVFCVHRQIFPKLDYLRIRSQVPLGMDVFCVYTYADVPKMSLAFQRLIIWTLEQVYLETWTYSVFVRSYS